MQSSCGYLGRVRRQMLVGMNTATAGGVTRLLADGNQVPVLGLGVWQVPDGRECVDAVRWALETGDRHIDTAQAYGNEESVGRALRDSGVPRDQVFITTKFLPRRNDPVADPGLGWPGTRSRTGTGPFYRR